jgi:hypothetical protein
MITKNIFNAKKMLLLAFVGTMTFSGCKKFLDVNQNPNNPDTAEPTLLLPTVEAAVGQIVGNAFQTNGGIWSQYWTQSPTAGQYKTIDQYAQPNTSFDRPWLTLYRTALINAELIITSKNAGIQYTQGMAYILKAYTVQLTTDAFGDIPLAEALKGNQFGSPHYQAQSVVYDSIFNYIDKGIGLLSVANSSNPGTQDILFQGNTDQWKAFANTLKLRAYLRIAKVDPAKASAGIAAMYNGTTPVFLTKDASILYSSIGGNENPLYNEMVALGKTQNLVASSTAVDAFTKNNDPRLSKFYDLITVPAGDSTKMVSIPQGSYAANTGATVSLPSALVGASPNNAASATAPVKLISSSESYFLQAEAVARGYAKSGVVADLYSRGINASFTAVGADIGTYLTTAPDAIPALTAAGGSVEAQVKAIITQKYYAMCGFQGFEAWTEWRRTGYPDFIKSSAASLLEPGLLPLRFIYPSSESLSNSNYPGTVPVTTPVWWDK